MTLGDLAGWTLAGALLTAILASAAWPITSAIVDGIDVASTRQRRRK